MTDLKKNNNFYEVDFSDSPPFFRAAGNALAEKFPRVKNPVVLISVRVKVTSTGNFDKFQIIFACLKKIDD